MTETVDTPRSSRLPGQARRKQLLAAAQEVFVSNGYHAAAMDDIAERAGVSKPVLYQHFPGKLELYLALLDAQAEALAERVRAGLAQSEDNEVRLHNVLVAYFDFIDGESRGDDGAFRLIFASDLANEPAVRARVDNLFKLTMQAVAETVAADTGLPRAQSELLATALMGSAQIAATWWVGADRPIDKSEAIRLLQALHWRGLGHFPLAGKPDAHRTPAP